MITCSCDPLNRCDTLKLSASVTTNLLLWHHFSWCITPSLKFPTMCIVESTRAQWMRGDHSLMSHIMTVPVMLYLNYSEKLLGGWMIPFRNSWASFIKAWVLLICRRLARSMNLYGWQTDNTTTSLTSKSNSST